MAALATSLFLDAGQLIAQVVTAVAPQPDVTKVNILVGHSDTDNTLGGNALRFDLRQLRYMDGNTPTRGKEKDLGPRINR